MKIQLGLIYMVRLSFLLHITVHIHLLDGLELLISQVMLLQHYLEELAQLNYMQNMVNLTLLLQLLSMRVLLNLNVMKKNN